MIARPLSYRLVQLSILAVVLAATGVLGLPPAIGAELDKLDTSLKLIPADAAIYASMLRNREQFEAVRHSNAWAKIQAMPAVQMGLAFYQVQAATPGSGPAKIQAALANPETRKIVDLAKDMVSDEVFLYGDKSCIDFLKLVQNVMSAVRYGPVIMQATGQAKNRNPNQLQATCVISALAKHADLIGIPDMVVGFKLKTSDLAKEQLIKLEAIGNIILEANEQTKGRFKKTKAGDSEYLVLNLDGGMIPWDQVPTDKFKEREAAEGDAQKVIDRLKKTKLALAIGVRGNYLLCSMGSSLSCLEKLGQATRLVDRPEFKPAEKFADKRLASIGYVSAEMNRQANNQMENVNDLLKLADKLLPLAKLNDQQSERVRKDLAGLADDLSGLIPKVGAQMGLSFLCDRGIEGYAYAWGGHGRLDGSKPLGLLQHVGGSPILGMVARMNVTPQDYDLLVKWVKLGYGYFDEFGLPNMPEKERQKVKTFLASAMPLFQRLDKVTREMRIPALSDGQLALVIDGKLTSKRFLESLPETEKPMPMIEPAFVRGVSDAQLLKKSFGEYRAIANGLIDAVRQIEGAEVPEWFRVPAPKVSEVSSGTIYSFALPKEWGVDPKIAPTIGLSNEVAVVSLSSSQTERLLKATPLKAGGVLEKADRPLAAAVWLDWTGLIEAATPWVEFGLAQAASKSADAEKQKAVAEQVRTGLDVLKVLRSITGEAYVEGDVLVNHTLTEIHDVAK